MSARRIIRTLAAAFAAAFLLAVSGQALAQPVTLVFQYRGDDGARVEAVQAWIAEFEAENPDIKIEYLPAPSGYQDRTIVSWAAGTGPDITEIWGDWAQSYARAGVLLDLRPYIERDFTAEDRADFWPVSWEASFVPEGPYKGEQFRAPRYMITTVYYYNQEQIDAAGLVSPTVLDERGEWTYDALREMARKLMVSDGNQVTRWGFTTNTRDYRRLSVWARAFGGDFFNMEDTREFLGAEQGAVRAMQLLQEMIWSDQSTSPTFIPNQFYNGAVALVEEGNHAVLSRFERNIQGSFRWNIAPVPVGPNGRKAYSGDDGFVIWRDTAHPDEAWRFVKFLVSTRGQEIVAQHEGLAPVRRSAMPFYQELAPHLNMNVHMINMLDAGLPTTSFLVGDVVGIANAVNNALTAVMVNNEKSWEVAAQEIKPVVESLARQQ